MRRISLPERKSEPGNFAGFLDLCAVYNTISFLKQASLSGQKRDAPYWTMHRPRAQELEFGLQ